MIPSIQRKEWHDLVVGSIKPKIISHSLRLKINKYQKEIKAGKITVEEAINQLYQECKDHYKLYKNDLYQIFHLS
jgi:hypothetical protein